MGICYEARCTAYEIRSQAKLADSWIQYLGDSICSRRHSLIRTLTRA